MTLRSTFHGMIFFRFAFHDGVIGELCPDEAEENWVINFKRGILSSLQNTMQRFDVDFNNTESDISGTCDVSYSLAGAVGTSLMIEKRKNIESCINRYKTNSILQTTPYDFRKVILQFGISIFLLISFCSRSQNFAIWPLLRSQSSCNVRKKQFQFNPFDSRLIYLSYPAHHRS